MHHPSVIESSYRSLESLVKINGDKAASSVAYQSSIHTSAVYDQMTVRSGNSKVSDIRVDTNSSNKDGMYVLLNNGDSRLSKTEDRKTNKTPSKSSKSSKLGSMQRYSIKGDQKLSATKTDNSVSTISKNYHLKGDSKPQSKESNLSESDDIPSNIGDLPLSADLINHEEESYKSKGAHSKYSK